MDEEEIIDTVSIVRNYMGDDITPSCVERLMQGPEEHIGVLVQNLVSYYYDWLENEEARFSRAADASANDPRGKQEHEEITYYCMDPLDYWRTWREKLDTYKKYLLYFPRFAVPDPLAEFLWPRITAARVVGGLDISDEFKQNFQDALLLLAELAPTALKHDVILMPRAFAADYRVVQEAVNKELQATEQEREYWEPLYSLAAKHQTSRGGMDMIVEEVKIDGQLCAWLGLTPVAGHELNHRILRQDYNRGIRHLPTTSGTHRVAQTLLRYDLPGVEKASFERVIALRNSENAFWEWRTEFGRVLDKAQSEQPADEEQFEAEFREAADASLMPRVKELEKAAASSVLEKWLVPSALALGASAIAFSVAGLPVPPTTAGTAALVGPGNWAVDKIMKRFNKGGRKATILREFYGYLLAREK